MARRTISVVIPVKDDARMLARCLATLRRQSRPADEVVVVDNGSSDDSAAVARRFGARVIAEARPGITAAASAGYDAAAGDIVARCDADSRLPRGWLRRIERMLDAHPEAVAITGRGTFYDLGRVANAVAGVLYMRAYFVAVHGAIANTPLFGSNFAMRREVWDRVSADVPRDDPDLHDDFDLSYRLDPSDRVVYDRRLVVGISGRPFGGGGSMRRRMRMAGATMAEHLPHERPTRRWRRRLRDAPR